MYRRVPSHQLPEAVEQALELCEGAEVDGDLLADGLRPATAHASCLFKRSGACSSPRR